MTQKVTFSTFDPICYDVPVHCHLCASNPPVFRYETSVDKGSCELPHSDFCCADCATRLLEELQEAESRAWAVEEEYLKEEGIDATDLEERRLATFGATQRD